MTAKTSAAKKAKPKAKAVATQSERVPFQIRFRRELHSQLERIAKENFVSLNVLLEAIARQAVADKLALKRQESLVVLRQKELLP